MIAFYAFFLSAVHSFTADKTRRKPSKKVNFPPIGAVSTAPPEKLYERGCLCKI
ncbi:hypothetical protein CHCC20335_3561 [Bacillus paralicheniformis]|nr:hypothetical protein CHCC20335_3561 [Bacillus paralicheniformis]